MFAFLMETGTGKTKPILEEWQERVAPDGGDLDNLAVIAPAGSYKNWFQDHPGEPSEMTRNLDPELRRVTSWAAWADGAEHRKRRERLTTAPRPRAFFMNVEALSRGRVAFDYVSAFLRSGRSMLVVDESTVIRAGEAARTKRVMELADIAEVRRIATGLVSPKSPLDLFWQFYFLDWRIIGMPSPVAFRARYAEAVRICYIPTPVIRARLAPRYKGTIPLEELGRDALLEQAALHRVYVQAVDKITGFRNLDELQQKIAPYSYRVLKSDCLTLPPKVYAPIRELDLTPQQRSMYDEIKNYAVAAIENSGGKYASASTIVTQMMRLHQIVCGYVVDEEGAVHDLKSNRIDDIMVVLAEHDRKGIVWVPYRHELAKVVARIKEEYGPASVAEFHGGNTKTRDADENRFKTDPACRWIVSTQSAGGKGNNWQVADLTDYAANTYDLEHRFQSEDRNHRRGQSLPVTYVDRVVRGTVEERILFALRNKIDLMTAVTGENYREWLI